MSNIRLIATDLDGTFFDAHSQTIPANVDAFREAQASGIAVAICSGRCPVDIRYVHRQMGLDTWIIGFNGAVVREPGAPADIFCQPLERPALERLLTFLEEDQDVYYNMCTVGLRYLMARGRHRARAESGRLHLGAHGVQTHFIDSWREIPEAELDRCMKVIASSPDRSEAERLKRDAAGAGFPLTITSSWWNNIEVVARGVDKGVGIQRLCGHLHRRRDGAGRPEKRPAHVPGSRLAGGHGQRRRGSQGRRPDRYRLQRRGRRSPGCAPVRPPTALAPDTAERSPPCFSARSRSG